MTIGLSNQLIIPLTLWGNRAPTHCISSIYLSRDLKILVTGCNDGQLLIWDLIIFKSHQVLIPRCMLFGHSYRILCLTNATFNNNEQLLVSSSEDGEMCLWDLSDGQCLESTRLQYVHTNIQTQLLQGSHEVRLVCNGYYSEILIINPITFEIVLTLTSRVNPDWILAIDIVYPGKPQDNIIGLTISGMIKVWVLTGNETRQSEPIYEQEFKQIRCLNALKLTCCSYNQSTVLIVCSKNWQIYDAYDFSLLCSVESKTNERWLGGEFISAEKIIVWSDTGKGYLYQLPKNCIPELKEFHEKSNTEQLHPYAVLSIANDQRLLCSPAMKYYSMPWLLGKNNHQYERLLIRGGSGQISIWFITNDIINCNDKNANQSFTFEPNLIQSLNVIWKTMNPTPAGIMDNLNIEGSLDIKITASVFLPLQGTFIAGREDGSIIIIYAIQTFKLQLLNNMQETDDWPQYQILLGHSGRVTCLLYPHLVDNRYAIEHLVSSGVDFSVCLWDLYAGTLLHRFSVHAGEVTQLLVPPKDCSNRVLNSICSVASDHSVALLSLKEKKCIMLASRHIFPISIIKWRPLEDFMIVGCVDGSVYVWQMETGLLDRVIHGLLAEDVLNACDDHILPTTSEDKLTNPAIHLFRGLKSRNIAAIKHATARGFRHIAKQPNQQKQDIVDLSIQSRSHSLTIQGLKTNPKDQDIHVLFFDVESLVVDLLVHQYSFLSPNAMESQGLTNTILYKKYLHLSSSPEASHKFSKIFVKVKDSAENAAQKIQAKAESVGLKPNVNVANEIFYGVRKFSGNEELLKSERSSITSISKRSSKWPFRESDLTLEISQILLSLLHAWGLDLELDRVCKTKLGLLVPVRPICFGLLSKGGYMSLLLPTFILKFEALKKLEKESNDIELTEPIKEDDQAKKFTSTYHWELSHAITTNHILTIVSLAKTIMSMNNVTFLSDKEKRKYFKKVSVADSNSNEHFCKKTLDLETNANQQKQAKEGWSLLGILHCGLLPEFIKSLSFKAPLLDVLAKRWQDKCLEIREAAQNILLCELKRIGPKGRKQLVDEWAPYLSQYEDRILPQNQVVQINQHNNFHQTSNQSQTQNETDLSQDDYHVSEDEDIDSEEKEKEDTNSSCSYRKSSFSVEYRKKTSTAIILLGVVGSVYGQGIEVGSNAKRNDKNFTQKTSVIEGFGAGNYSIARRTAHALLHLLLAPPSKALPKHNYLRRAAIDLIGRGFVVWEPYLDITKVLLALLELCCDFDSLIPTLSFALPLTPASDSCRTARYAISQIASSRPEKFIITLNQEVARYNTLQQNAQSVNVSLACTVLNRAKPEILRNLELLIDKKHSEISDLIIETMDILLHCLDSSHLKNKGLNQIFPIISKFPFVSSCAATRRIAVGAKNGNLAIYEPRTPKQIINAHGGSITCCSFSSDGRHLVTYCKQKAQLCFWSTATSLFGLGNSQTKCVKTYNTPLVPENLTTLPELIWAANKMVLLILPDGKQYQYVV